MGLAHHRAGRLVEAERAYREGLKGSPDDVRLWANLGAVLAAREDLAGGIEALRRALALRPGEIELVAALGRAYERAGDSAGVIEMLMRAVELQPSNTGLRVNLGLNLLGAGRDDEALVELEKAVAQAPESLDARVGLGKVKLTRRDFDGAYEAFLAAAAIDPASVAAYEGLGLSLALQGSARPAEVCLRKARELGGGPGDEFRAALLLPTVYRSQQELLESRQRYEAALDRLLESGLVLEDPYGEVGTTSFLLTYQNLDDRALQEKLARAYREACPSLAWTAPHCAAGGRRREGRMRIGLLSRFFTNHTIGKVNRGIIEALDRERFEVTAILAGPPDAVTPHVVGTAERTIALGGTLAQMRQQVADAELDILFFTDIGMEPVSYYLAYARLAPLQVVTWGHPDTTGLDSIDYFISSSAVEPDGAPDLYTEPLALLSRIPTCYRRPALNPAVVGAGAALIGRSALPFEADWHVYACAQSLFKAHPDFDELLGEILRRDPAGRVVFVDGHTHNWSEILNSRLEATIPDVADRVLFLPRLSELNYFHLLAGADALLDAPHFSGGSTTYESFALGAPIVTWPGRFGRSRVTAACYGRMGMADVVTRSADEYVAAAVRLANDPGWRQELRGRILAANHAIFDDLELVRELEDWLAARLDERLSPA